MPCEFNKKCNNKCPSLKRTCSLYRKLFLRSVYDTLPAPHPESDLVKSVLPIEEGRCIYSVSPQKLQARLLKTVSRHLTKVHVYSYNTAIQAALEEGLPDEMILYIDASPKYADLSKGLQTIESLIDQCIQSRKTVFLRTKADYSNPNYQKC